MKQQKIEENFREIISHLGLDINDPSLKDTPKRVAKMYCKELCYGLDKQNFPECTTFPNKNKYDEMVVVANIKVHSLCEHHFLPFTGVAKIGYIPGKVLIGLSKINRIVDFFARKPQVQEGLTVEIFEKLQELLGVNDIGISIVADHLCVKIRGCSDHSITITNKFGGKFFDNPITRKEFLDVTKTHSPT